MPPSSSAFRVYLKGHHDECKAIFENMIPIARKKLFLVFVREFE